MKKIVLCFFPLVAILFFSCTNAAFLKAAKIYNVKFVTNGGSEVKEIYTNEISEIPYTQKENCEFGGWYTKSDLSEEAITFPFKVEKEITLYAKWLQKYSVQFETNGGSKVPNQITSTLETSPLSFKNDFALEGWYENADLSGGKISFPYAVTKETILYAKWLKTYNAIFDANGGIEVSPRKTALISESPKTSKNGFSFAGWYLSQEFSGEAISFPYEMTDDTTFYAKWAQIFTVNFETNGGSALPPMQTGWIENAPKSTKADASFGGWYFDADLKDKVEFPCEIKSDTTLYAKWTPIQCTITYNANGAKSGNPPKTDTADKGSAYTVQGNTGNLTKTGEAFTKWNTKADGRGTSYAPGAAMTVTEDVTLYAQWGKDYAQMIDVTGGTFTMGKDSSGSDVKHQVTLNDFRIAAYEVTYELWSEVYSWAKENEYTLINAGKGVTSNDKYTDFEPATLISWNMAVVWLNAYSEMKGLEPVYYYNGKILRDYSALGESTAITFDATKNGYRLPTEAEWEFAAGGGNYEFRDDLTYATTNANSKIDDFAWYSGNAGSETHPVGTKKPNYLGIYDMSGNVEEWCWDYDGGYSKDAQNNPKGPASGSYRIIRGGCYNSYYAYCKIRYRNYDNQTYIGDGCGLRIAQNAK